MFKLIARLFAPAPSPEGEDILAHPALARMSPAELADLPLSPFSPGGTPRAPGPAPCRAR